MIILYTGFFMLILYGILKNKVPLIFGFVLIFIIMGFQEGVEGDYMSYKDAFIHMEKSRTFKDEPLWDIISFTLHPIGWYAYVALMSFFQIVVLYNLTKRYVFRGFVWLSPILFFFWFGMMLIQMKAMRQGLSIELCLLPFVVDLSSRRHKWIWIFVPSLAAYLIHNSSFVLLPILLLYYLNLTCDKFDKIRFSKSRFYYPILITSFFTILYILKQTILYSYIQFIALTLTDFRLSSYLMLNETSGKLFNVSILIVIADALFVFILTWSYRYLSGKQRIICIAAIIANFMDMLFFGMGSLARIGYFYLPTLMIALPNSIDLVSKIYNKKFAYLITLLCIFYAIKTSLPMLTTSEGNNFADFRFIFM